MNWKQSLKPDWRKIVLTIILFGWFFFGFLTGGSEGEMGIFTIIGIIGLFVSLPAFYILSPIKVIDIFGEKEGQIIFFIIYFILIGIYSYLLSCLIFWVYDFLKRGVEKNRKEKIVEKKGFLEQWEERHKLATKIIVIIVFILGFSGSGLTIIEAVIIIAIILIVYLILKLRSKKKDNL
jgi:hypothetical protein